MKAKILSIGLAISLLLGSMGYSPKANAIIAATTWSFSVYLFSTMAGSAAVFVGVGDALDNGGRNQTRADLDFLVFLAGIVLLDDSHGRALGFGPITAEQGERLGLSEMQTMAYMHELAKINAVRESAALDVEQYANPTREQMQESLAKYSRALSPEAFSAAQIIATKFVQTNSK